MRQRVRNMVNACMSLFKRSLFLRVSIFCILLFSSCASYHTYPETEYVIASWYGPEFHGKPTSSGEPFDMYAYTCAHREYPFGTKLKVTHASNGRSVNCLINDRGPFVSGRDIDLSYAAAREIGLLKPGTSPVMIEYMGRDTSFIRKVEYASRAGPLTIQAGSFRELSNAQRLKTSLELKYSGIYIDEADVGGTFYRVRIGRFLAREDAVSLAETLADEGYCVLITRYNEKI
ncbi:MAG: septal ring lytic transglycosylase RlpA family protein [Nitrospirota bacterium]